MSLLSHLEVSWAHQRNTKKRECPPDEPSEVITSTQDVNKLVAIILIVLSRPIGSTKFSIIKLCLFWQLLFINLLDGSFHPVCVRVHTDTKRLLGDKHDSSIGTFRSCLKVGVNFINRNSTPEELKTAFRWRSVVLGHHTRLEPNYYQKSNKKRKITVTHSCVIFLRYCLYRYQKCIVSVVKNSVM